MTPMTDTPEPQETRQEHTEACKRGDVVEGMVTLNRPWRCTCASSSSPREPQKDETHRWCGLARAHEDCPNPATCSCPCHKREPREPHAALIAELDATLKMLNEDATGHCQLCEHPPVTGEAVEEQHYNDCLFFTLRRCLLALKGA